MVKCRAIRTSSSPGSFAAQRFDQLRRLLPSATQRMLTNQLRELEQDGFVARRIYAEIPPKVEYSLTERGRTLQPVLLALKALGGCAWGGGGASRGGWCHSLRF